MSEENCICPQSPIPYWHGDSRAAIDLLCPTHGWMKDEFPDTTIEDDDEAPPLLPTIWPSIEAPLYAVFDELNQEAADMLSPINLIIDPRNRKSAEELRRLILSLPDGFLDVIYRDLYEGRDKRIDAAKKGAEKYLASLPKEES